MESSREYGTFKSVIFMIQGRKECTAGVRKRDECETVGLVACRGYGAIDLQQEINRLLDVFSPDSVRGCRVFLKPNLVCATRKDGLACTHPQVVRAVVLWFLEHGAQVLVGDSPAFGSSREVMARSGITDALADLPVVLAKVQKARSVRLGSGLSMKLSVEMLESDMLVNLPKLKAHSQMLVSLAVKNLFGAVIGCRKAVAHMVHGGRHGVFEQLVVDLIKVLPAGVSLIDGIYAMHHTGPVKGACYELGLLGASRSPVALDTAILQVLSCQAFRSPLWRECVRQNMKGSSVAELVYPFATPEDFPCSRFELPDGLDPVRFQIGRFLMNGFRKGLGLR